MRWGGYTSPGGRSASPPTPVGEARPSPAEAQLPSSEGRVGVGGVQAVPQAAAAAQLLLLLQAEVLGAAAEALEGLQERLFGFLLLHGGDPFLLHLLDLVEGHRLRLEAGLAGSTQLAFGQLGGPDRLREFLGDAQEVRHYRLVARADAH